MARSLTKSAQANAHVDSNHEMVQQITQATKEIMTGVFNNLNSTLEKSQAGTKGEDIRLFFPKGIELINLDITIGPKATPAISFSVTIAGAAGVKPSANDPKHSSINGIHALRSQIEETQDASA